MKIYILESILNQKITVENFKSNGIKLKNLEYNIVGYAHGCPVDHLSFFNGYPVQHLNQDIQLIDCLTYSHGHWCEIELYEIVKNLMNSYNIPDKTDTICMILMVQKLYQQILEEKLPKMEKSNLGCVYDFLKKIDDTRQPSLKLTMPGGKETMSLTTEQTKYLSSILKERYINTSHGQEELEKALKEDEKEIKFHEKLNSLNIKNRANTYRLLTTRLIQRMYYLFQRKVPLVTERHYVIGKLLSAAKLHKSIPSDIEYTKKEEKEYYHNRLKKSTSCLK